MASRVKANAASNLAVRPRLGRLPVPKALPHQKENEKDWSVATSQRQVALAAPAKISISRAASIINASSSPQYRRRVKKAALLELREVLMAKAVANTKPKA